MRTQTAMRSLAAVLMLAVAGSCFAADTTGAASADRDQPAAVLDWSQELITADIPDLGHRYGTLSAPERGALRRGFKLPLDAIGSAQTPGDLARAAVVRPLPDPSRPFLPVGDADGLADPFGNAVSDTDLGPLGRLFDLEAGRISENSLIAQPGEKPFVTDLQDATSTNDAGLSPADLANPFGDDEDPFGDF